VLLKKATPEPILKHGSLLEKSLSLTFSCKGKGRFRDWINSGAPSAKFT